MNLNPGQWMLCHALKCKSLKVMECTEEKCSYRTEREKFKAVNARRREHFEAVQEKQNGPRLVIEAAKKAEGGR
ncbi:MAG: hypothetical protein MUO61_03565 [Dehalococcoidia bacterium]|nr:hypothetical protein [Dehalococcoidia bacterium]